uniref:Uncharacterized protein n=1 Tax=Strongyloides papillosus TaxID=174720 RepID=A0A0N5BTE4_STREA
MMYFFLLFFLYNDLIEINCKEFQIIDVNRGIPVLFKFMRQEIFNKTRDIIYFALIFSPFQEKTNKTL